MGDWKMEFLVRSALLVAIMGGTLIAVSVADIAINMALLHFGWPINNDSRIEGVVFIIVLYRGIWRWLKRRVQIGTETRHV